MIPDNSIDCYIAPLVLHLVESPDKMLAEAKRVLKKGGVFGCSIWGSRDNSPYFTLLPDRFKEFGVETSKQRSGFHLGDKDKLVGMAKEAGLDVEYCWTENVLKPIHKVEDLEIIFNVPGNKKIFDKLDEEKAK
mmetsp:Transcript_34137/g.30896  ORF Transcript_34137/g.30896 Transcript_34137/m.30896 type:complete len:134 (-) Transcript_34137:126-527(-)